MTSATFALRDVLPNPFRNFDLNPLQEGRIEALRRSIQRNGFWTNVVARHRPDGKAELAYGHHRIEAARRELGFESHVHLNLRDLDDRGMLQAMADENRENWTADALTIYAAVWAVVDAYGKGLITLDPVPPKTRADAIRHAPSFIPGRCVATAAAHPYTAETVASFLGWVRADGRGGQQAQSKGRDALLAGELIEGGYLHPDQLAGRLERLGPVAVKTTVEAHEVRVGPGGQGAINVHRPAMRISLTDGRVVEGLTLKQANRVVYAAVNGRRAALVKAKWGEVDALHRHLRNPSPEELKEQQEIKRAFEGLPAKIRKQWEPVERWLDKVLAIEGLADDVAAGVGPDMGSLCWTLLEVSARANEYVEKLKSSAGWTSARATPEEPRS